MSDVEEQGDGVNVQATNNSTAVGKIEVGGSISGNVNIGGTQNVTNIYQTALPESAGALDFVNATIETRNFEPETILIPDVGPFRMGFDAGEGIEPYDTPAHDVSLPVYRIGKYPVTNSQYYEFVLQGGPVNSEMNWEGRNVRYGFEDKPVLGVRLDDARKYCEWLSKVTNRKYTLPNEAQLEKAYRGSYGCSDIVDNLYQWTSTLWGQKGNAPDQRFRYPWQEDGRNNLNANSQIRRVVCLYPKQGIRQRSGQFPSDVGFPGARHSFRVVMVSNRE